MPAIRYFTVEQTREVRVSASTPTEAALLADRVFSGTKEDKDRLNVRSKVMETNLTVREEM